MNQPVHRHQRASKQSHSHHSVARLTAMLTVVSVLPAQDEPRHDDAKSRASTYYVNPDCEEIPEYRCVTVQPAVGLAANLRPNIVSYFVNGVANSERESKRSAQMLAQHLGRPVIRIHNESEGLATDLRNAALGKLSSRLGSLVERSTYGLYSEIARHFKDPSGVTADIHAHSQGSIIVANALTLLRKREYPALSDSDWDKLVQQRLRVTVYGAAQHTFPVRNVVEYSRTGDMVSLGTRFAEQRMQCLPYKFSSQLTSIDGREHSFALYALDLPEFTAKRMLLEAKGSGERLTALVAQSIARGNFSTKFYERLVGSITCRSVEASNTPAELIQLKIFAERFKALAKAGELKHFEISKRLKMKLNSLALLDPTAPASRIPTDRIADTQPVVVPSKPTSPADSARAKEGAEILERNKARAESMRRELVAENNQREALDELARKQALRDRAARADASARARAAEDRIALERARVDRERSAARLRAELHRPSINDIEYHVARLDREHSRMLAEGRRAGERLMQSNRNFREKLVQDLERKQAEKKKMIAQAIGAMYGGPAGAAAAGTVADKADARKVKPSQSMQGDKATKQPNKATSPKTGEKSSLLPAQADKVTKDQLWNAWQKHYKETPSLHGTEADHFTKDDLWNYWNKHRTKDGGPLHPPIMNDPGKFHGPELPPNSNNRWRGPAGAALRESDPRAVGPTLPAKFELGSQVPKLKVPSEGPTIGPLRREPITGKALPFSNLEQYFNERDQDLVRENAQAVLKGAGKGALGALKKGRVTWGGIGGGALQGATKERAKLELKRVAKGILGEGKKANAYDLESLRMLERANQLRKIPHGFRREIDDLEYKYLIDSFRERQRYIRAMNRSEGGK